MIRFIDTETYNVYDGQSPYIHWFDEAQSVNLIYSKKLFVVSNYPQLTIVMPDSGVFDILQTDAVDAFAQQLAQTNAYEIYDNRYLKIDREQEDDPDAPQTACAPIDEGYIHYTSTGTQYSTSEYYVHRFYFIAKSQEAGERIEDFVITTSNDIEEFSSSNSDALEVIHCQIGADFYNEDERLSISLKNFGMECPSLVQKAIFEGNVHEEYQDNILINRKWKELLINYQDCLMCKGSYKSLLNCLDWFGYGDNIRLLEYWRKAYDDGTLFEDDMRDTLYNITREMLVSKAKTTYIGILLAVQKISGEYDQYEPVPIVENKTDLLYSISDICLKMTLLGNFFSTYFMPIHLDLIHCSIEDIVYSTCIKLIAEGENKRVDFNDSNEELLVDLDSNFQLGEIHTHVYVDTYNPVYYDDGDDSGYRFQVPTFANLILENEGDPIGGVETEIRKYVFTEEYQAAQYGAQMYGGPGCIVNFTCQVPNIENTSNCLVAAVQMKISLGEHSTFKNILTNIPAREYDEETQQYVPRKIQFKYLFTEYGDYTVDLIFQTNTGKDYHKTLKFTIEENIFNGLAVKKVVKRDPEELYKLSTLNLENPIFSYQLTPEGIPSVHSQYLFCGPQQNTVGLNSIVVIRLDTSSNITIYYGDAQIEVQASDEETMLNQLKFQCPWYLWFVRNTVNIGDETIPYLIGIRKNFTLPESGENLQYTSSSIWYSKSLYKTFAYSVDIRKHYSRKSIEYELKLTYNFLQNLTATKLYTMVIYGLHRNGETEPIRSGSVNLLSDVKNFHIEFDVDDEDLGITVHLTFDDDIPQYNYYSLYGGSNRKIYKMENGDNSGILIAEERFVPIFHKTEELEDDTAKTGETIIIEPKLKYMKEIVRDGVNAPLWTFCNASSGREYRSQYIDGAANNIVRPIVGAWEPIMLTPGYYDVSLDMKLWDNSETEIIAKAESLFKLEKSV